MEPAAGARPRAGRSPSDEQPGRRAAGGGPPAGDRPQRAAHGARRAAARRRGGGGPPARGADLRLTRRPAARYGAMGYIRRHGRQPPPRGDRHPPRRVLQSADRGPDRRRRFGRARRRDLQHGGLRGRRLGARSRTRSPVDEHRRDELLEAFQTHYHPGDARSVSRPRTSSKKRPTTSRTTKRSVGRTSGRRRTRQRLPCAATRSRTPAPGSRRRPAAALPRTSSTCPRP